jgi:ribosome-associated protein|tara:strand:+ start:303 stop:662 length:360 start_codon:yes stop_codon:yes gene_type:complete
MPINTNNTLLKNINLILDNAKAESISIVDLKNKTSIADFFVIATCRSTRHAGSTADEIIDKLKNFGIKCPSPAGRPQCDWVIVDAGNIIIHLFRKEIRELYSLEKLWGMTFDNAEDETT